MLASKAFRIGGFSLCLLAGAAHAELCQGFGPQTPRDISSSAGSNPVVFSTAPGYEQLSLCDIHFHKFAEHKGPGFSLPAPAGKHGGFQCNERPRLSSSQLEAKTKNYCKEVQVGDTIEVHWVFSSCHNEPGPGLGSCLSDSCSNPQLRVETQVFLVTAGGANFSDFSTLRRDSAGRYQPARLPAGTGDPVTFLGSTTGPSFSEEVCSPLQVTWSVRPQCKTVDVASLSKWCEKNVFEEHKAHGVRALVSAPELLSEIK